MQNMGEVKNQVQNQVLSGSEGNQNLNNDNAVEQIQDEQHLEGNVEHVENTGEISEEHEDDLPDNVKKHFRKLEKKLKRENYRLNNQLMQTQQQLQSYQGLFNSTYANAYDNSNEQPKAPVDEVEQKVIGILQKNQQQIDVQTKARLAQEREHRLNLELVKNLQDTATKYDDFEESIGDDSLPFNNSNAILNITRYLPNAGDVLYELSKNPAEAHRIAHLDFDSQIKAIAQHAINLAAGKSVNTTTKAPKPLNGGNLRGVPTPSTDLNTMSYQQMKAYLKKPKR